MNQTLVEQTTASLGRRERQMRVAQCRLAGVRNGQFPGADRHCADPALLAIGQHSGTQWRRSLVGRPSGPSGRRRDDRLADADWQPGQSVHAVAGGGAAVRLWPVSRGAASRGTRQRSGRAGGEFLALPPRFRSPDRLGVDGRVGRAADRDCLQSIRLGYLPDAFWQPS